MAVPWDPLLKPTSVLFHMQNVSRGGGPASNGMEQVVTSLAGRWRGTVNLLIRTRAERLAMRGLLVGLQGRSNTVLVPVFDCYRVGHTATVTEPATKGDTLITVTIGTGTPLEVGEYLSIAGHLHIVQAWADPPGMSGEIQIWPPLRADVADNATAEIASPVCEMRLASDDSGEMMLEQLRRSRPTLEFVEAY